MGCNASKLVIPVAEGATETPETAEDASTKSTETFTVPAPPNDNNGDDDITISARTCMLLFIYFLNYLIVGNICEKSFSNC